MSGSDRQTDRIVRSWLENGVTRLPDRLLDGVLDQLPDTRQRQPLSLTRRFSHMSSSLRIALAALAAVVVAGGLALLSGQNVGGPSRSATPSPTNVSTPTPRAHADGIPFADVPLDPGTYSFYGTLDTGQELRVSMTVPAGWTGHESWYVYRSPILSGGAGVAVSPWVDKVNLVYVDPCQHDVFLRTGSTAAELAAAFIETSMHDGAEPIDITVDGYAGKEIHISTDPAIDQATCRGEAIIPWIEGSGGSERHVIAGTRQTLWILDVEGSRLVIDASAEPGADISQRIDLRQVLQSIQIEVS